MTSISDPSGSDERLQARLAAFLEDVRTLLESCRDLLPKVQACVGQMEPINLLIEERRRLLVAEGSGKAKLRARAERLNERIGRAYEPFPAV